MKGIFFEQDEFYVVKNGKEWISNVLLGDVFFGSKFEGDWFMINIEDVVSVIFLFF